MPDGQLGQVVRQLRRLIGRGAAPSDGTDGQLLERFVADRDPAAFEGLVQRHGSLVLGLCRRILRDAHTTEDAFQATFVVLARKAASIRKRESISSWLYGVAYRVAVRARVNLRKQQAREIGMDNMAQPVPATPSSLTDPHAHVDRDEVLSILDEELQRLPEKHRAPLLLCYFQGRTSEQAAQELACPPGSMSWRLAQAREQLRERLGRRGVDLSAAALATLFSQTAAPAAIPASLVDVTIKAALVAAGGPAATGALSAEVAALSEGVLQTMRSAKMKLLVVLFLTFAVIASGLGGWMYLALARDNPSAGAGVAIPKEPPPAAETVQGLKLTISADKLETTMLPDESNVTPIQVKLTFTNVSDKPIKLDTHILNPYKITCQITGPEDGSVEVKPYRGPQPKFAPATAANYPIINPKESHEYKWAVTVPKFVHGFDREYILRKPGRYRIRLTYSNDREATNEFAKGSWTGKLDSNELVLKVMPAASGK